MSERRQLALMAAGVVALVAVGVVGATVFPEKCADLEQQAELSLAFADAAVALSAVDDADGDLLQDLGADGLGPWRGAVRLPREARVLPSSFGFFVVTPEAYTVLRPSIGIVSAARGRAGLDVFGAGTSIALRAGDGETGIYNAEYELDRCGTLPVDADVLAIDRGFAVVVGPDDLGRLVTLSGDEVWTVAPLEGDEPPAGVTAARFEDDLVLLERNGSVEARSLRTGELRGGVTDVTLDGVGVTDDGDVEPLLDGRPLAVEDLGALPGGAEAVEVLRSGDGHTAVLVVSGDERALLVYAPTA